MRIKAAIFDMDGVLIDSEPLYERSDAEFYRSLGLTFTEEDRRLLMGCSGLLAGERIREKYPQLTLSAREIAELYNRSILGALTGSRELALQPGVPEWMDAFQAAGLRLAIASSSTRPMVYGVADRFGLRGRMTAIVTGDEVKYSKPEPAIYLEAARRLGLSPGECLAVEDSPNGVAAAKAAGMLCVGYLATNHHGSDLSRADLCVRGFEQDELARVFAAAGAFGDAAKSAGPAAGRDFI